MRNFNCHKLLFLFNLTNFPKKNFVFFFLSSREKKYLFFVFWQFKMSVEGYSFKKTSIEILGGTVGGMMQALGGHPLDLLKTRMQTGQYQSSMQCMKQTYKFEGLRGFYKGVSSPLIGSCFLNAALFGLNGSMRRLLSYMTDTPVEKFRVQHILVSSIMTAPCYALVLTPFELVKCQLASQTEGKMGPFTAVKNVVKERGVGGLFRGYTPTMAMRFVGLPPYFGCNEATKMFLREKLQTEQLSFGWILFSGGMGGIGFWSVCYPFDLIKTRVQLSNASEKALTSSIAAIYQKGGILGFYQGFWICILRAFPANAVAFYGVELVKRAFLEERK